MKYSLLVLLVCVSCVLTQDLIFKNSCPFVLWAEGHGENNALIPGETSAIKKMAANGGTVSWTVPSTGLASTRFWAKYGCDGNGANCAIGDQVPNSALYSTGCPANGCTPPLDSLFEATWGCKLSSGCPSGSSSVTWFDTSQVDGFTMPYRVTITGNNQCDCTGSGCTTLTTIDGSRLSMANCPTGENLSNNGQFSANANENLRYVVNGQTVACKSPCKHLTLPAVQQGLAFSEGSSQAEYYCCPTPNPSNCLASQGCITSAECRAGPIVNTQYVKNVHAETTDVYAYTYDDTVGLHTCPASGVQYTMEFCPSGSPAYPIGTSTAPGTTSGGSSSSSSGSSSGQSTSGCGSGLSFCAGNGQCYTASQYTCGTKSPFLCPASAPHFCNGGCSSASC